MKWTEAQLAAMAKAGKIKGYEEPKGKTERLKNFRTTRTEKRGSKFGNVSQMYNGHRYDSKKEAGYAKELDLRMKARGGSRILGWTRQFTLDLRVNGKHVTNWRIDFRIVHVDGSIEFCEVKGAETEAYRIKRNLFEALLPEMYPGAILTIIK